MLSVGLIILCAFVRILILCNFMFIDWLCEQVDKKVIEAIAKQTDRQKFPLVKYYCMTVTAKHSINFTDG